MTKPNQYERENKRRRLARKANPEAARKKARAYYHSKQGQEVRRKWLTTSKAKEHYRRFTVKRYGISLETYKELLDKQGSVCAICFTHGNIKSKDGKAYSLSVDHCHKTGKVRGLLCHKCNAGLGLFDDDKDRIMRVVRYLL